MNNVHLTDSKLINCFQLKCDRERINALSRKYITAAYCTIRRYRSGLLDLNSTINNFKLFTLSFNYLIKLQVDIS